MALPSPAHFGRIAQRLRRHLGQAQHRTAYFLVLNNVLGAAAGFLFWLLLARFGGLSTATLGIGFAMVALSTIVAVIAKGGLDTALLQTVPATHQARGRGLLAVAMLVSTAAAVALTALLAAASNRRGLLPDLTLWGWALVACMSGLMVVTWLQDAYVVALGKAQLSFERNLVLAIARLALPFPVIALAFAHPIPVTWSLALLASVLVGLLRAVKVPPRAGRAVSTREFLGRSARNLSGGAAEFLPGLLLTPLVLILDGPEAAAYFGIAWTAAQLVFQISAAIGRSALAQMVQAGPSGRSAAIGKGVMEHVWLVAPLAILGALFAPQFLAVFGQAYASQATVALAILCASVVFVAPTSLHFAVLRSRERSRALVLFPVAMIASLAVWSPLLGARYGLTGVALAWLLSNAPFGLYATWALRRETREVTARAAPALHRRLDLE